ncbi:MAG: T9SS type A sorting domain-containing protein [Bacteroidia bacterium]|nr:T9SS type A sorting domain-containing protein [Bacteroidia bacterium]
MKKYIYTTFLFLFCIKIWSQRTCGTGILPQQFEVWLQQYANSINQQAQAKFGNNAQQSNFVIPVIVHIIHNNQPVNSPTTTNASSLNLHANQVYDQINILNKDFNGLNADTALIPAPFKPLLGKFNISFCPAVVNPTGGILPEPGINRINRVTMGWTAPPYSMSYIDNTIKPATIWDPNRYFNIWVTQLSGGLLGYATFPNPGTSGLPGIPPPYGSNTTDGVVIGSQFFGSIGTAVSGAPFNKGRTATHEVGHWVGLRHIWGDGTCASDFCNDTPTQSGSTAGCPTYPQAAGCTGVPNPPGKMFMNYMDYVDDACMYMFTKDQMYRAQLIMTGSPMRAALLTSTVCNLPSVTNDLGIMYVSSPTYSQVINCLSSISPSIALKNFGSNLITQATFTYNVDGVNTQTYNWSGNLPANSSLVISMPPVSGLSNGLHTYTVGITSVNSGPDTYTINNGNSQLFSITGAFTIAATSATICTGQSATLTASGGASSYTWNPGGITGTQAVVSPTTTTTYTLAGSVGTCVNTVTTSVIVSASLNINVNTATICSTGSATLTASGATSYTWNTGSNASSIVVSPTVTTVYTVSGTNGSCSGTKTTTVTVTPSPTVNVNTATICSGSTATLTASGATSYSWSTGSTAPSITVSPSSTTVYTVTGTSSGCSNTKTTQVTVNASPTVNVNNASICSGQSATLTATGASTYSWSTGATSNSIVVSPSVSTTYTVTGTTAGCSNSQISQVTVNTTPTVNVNTAVICSGQSAILTASGATSYSWNTGSTAPSITVSPSSTTNYTVIGFNGSCANTKTTQVIVNPSPTVNVNSATICAGNSAVLTASGAASYSWNTGATTASISVSPSVTTVYTVTGVTSGCSNTKTTQVTVNSATASISSSNGNTICINQTYTLTASGNITTYTWNTGANTSAITNSHSTAGTYTFSVNGTDANGCQASATFTMNVSVCAGLQNAYTDLPFQLYPNPFNQNIHIHALNEVKVYVYTALGQMIRYEEGKNIIISSKEWAGGIYIVKIMAGNQTFTRKMIKE